MSGFRVVTPLLVLLLAAPGLVLLADDRELAHATGSAGWQRTGDVRLVAPADPGDAGFLVVAPDRGFLGNEEVRDAWLPFGDRFRAELAFLPWEGDVARFVRPALARLRDRGARSVAVLPLMLSVLVIPARTTQSGPAAERLAPLEGVRVGTGFAPHELFARWVEDQLAEGRRALAGRIAARRSGGADVHEEGE